MTDLDQRIGPRASLVIYVAVIAGCLIGAAALAQGGGFLIRDCPRLESNQ